MTTPPIEFEEQDRAVFMREIDLITAAALARDETAIVTTRIRSGWYYARIEFVEAAE